MGGILRRKILVLLAAGRVGLVLLVAVMWLIGGFDNQGGLMLLYMTIPLTGVFLSLVVKYVGDHRYLPAGKKLGSGYEKLVKGITFSVCAVLPLLVLLQGFFFLLSSAVFFFTVFLLELSAGAYAGYMLSDVFSDVVIEEEGKAGDSAE